MTDSDSRNVQRADASDRSTAAMRKRRTGPTNDQPPRTPRSAKKVSKKAKVRKSLVTQSPILIALKITLCFVVVFLSLLAYLGG